MNEALRELLDARDRTPIDGARPIVALDVTGADEGDEGEADADGAALDAALAAEGRARVVLERRGRAHGTWVELDPELDARSELPRPSMCRRRFTEARPLVWRGRFAPALTEWRNEIHGSVRAGEKLLEGGGLESLMRTRLARHPRFALARVDASGGDTERDLATAHVLDRNAAPGALASFAKAGRLSTFDGDASVRLRFGFGREVDDDDSDDRNAHRATTALARAVFPELALVDDDAEFQRELAQIAGLPLGAACPIAYWNRPQGGALFHHDAFAAAEENGQRGVLFVQLAGATAWLALSTLQLAKRVFEFAEQLTDAPWIVEELAPSGALDAVAAANGDPFALVDELGAPGQGRLGALVNHGPAFTSFLADLGHAVVLRAGDAILLPNHGWRATALHSVFCASSGPNFALSLGLRPRALVGGGARR
jgi:hypothetical protein